MLAGDVFDNRAVLRRLRVFRAIYAIPRCSWRRRRCAAGCGAAARSASRSAATPCRRAIRERGAVALPRSAPRLRGRLRRRCERRVAARRLLARDDTLAVFGFGDAARRPATTRATCACRCSRMRRRAVRSLAQPAARCRAGDDGEHRAGPRTARCSSARSRLDEARRAASRPRAAAAYARLTAFVRARGYPAPAAHLELPRRDHRRRRRRRALSPVLRRPRRAGSATFDAGTLPAATAIGRRDGVRTPAGVLAGRAHAGHAAGESAPAQRLPLSAPVRPAAAELRPRDAAAGRATMPLLLSGTASVVGHESRHARLHRIAAGRDLRQLRQPARRRARAAAGAAGALRQRLAAEGVRARPRRSCRASPRCSTRASDPTVPRILLHAAICRRELRVEIDGVPRLRPALQRDGAATLDMRASPSSTRTENDQWD